jgi:hypothetical protein
VRHWVDDGVTDVGNGALLCGRHHDVVHRDRLVATVRSRGGGEHGMDTPAVEWDLRAGSYDRALERWRAEEADVLARGEGPDGAPVEGREAHPPGRLQEAEALARAPGRRTDHGTGGGSGHGTNHSWTGLGPVLPEGVPEAPLDAVPWDDPDWEPEDPGPHVEAWEDGSDAWPGAIPA